MQTLCNSTTKMQTLCNSTTKMLRLRSIPTRDQHSDTETVIFGSAMVKTLCNSTTKMQTLCNSTTKMLRLRSIPTREQQTDTKTVIFGLRLAPIWLARLALKFFEREKGFILPTSESLEHQKRRFVHGPYQRPDQGMGILFSAHRGLFGPRLLHARSLSTLNQSAHQLNVCRCHFADSIKRVNVYSDKPFVHEIRVGAYMQYQLGDKAKMMIRAMITTLVEDIRLHRPRIYNIEDIITEGGEIRITKQRDVSSPALTIGNFEEIIFKLCGSDLERLPCDLMHMMSYLTNVFTLRLVT
ncbi:hypothetical protein V6N13_035706 [Hibiscus sabdariffa]|uniref:Uncharacterized protein n=1 Tax=Hibiscus sabdariffa TaxID=183260 RepID=A0ABR2S8L9_9ROSI